jgi:hypothetical protein
MFFAKKATSLLALSAAALVGLSAMNAIPADAAVYRPDTSVVRCTASDLWLELQGSTGDACFTGNGSLAVNLPGVYHEQIIGTHTVCVSAQGGRQVLCAAGPGSFGISPPTTIRGINIYAP